MKLPPDEARARLGAQVHGVLGTLNPERGPDVQPVVYALSDDGHVGAPIDRVKPKSRSRLQCEDNLAADPRGSLLVEWWEVEHWSRQWWVRARLEHLPGPPPELVDELADQLARTVRQYAEKPFHRLLVFRIVDVTGWAASSRWSKSSTSTLRMARLSVRGAKADR